MDSQLKFFIESENFQYLLQFEPIRVSNLLSAYFEKLFQEKRQAVLLDLISNAKINLNEVAGNLVSSMYAIADSQPTYPFMNSLIGDTPKSMFNTEELEFARLIDGLGHPWFRNHPGRNWYAVPGGNGSNFYPDFVICFNQNSSRVFNKIVAIETKGAHLVDNADSTNKRNICDSISNLFDDQIRLIFGDFELAKVELLDLLDEH